MVLAKIYDDGLERSQFINGLERSQLLDNNSSSETHMVLKIQFLPKSAVFTKIHKRVLAEYIKSILLLHCCIKQIIKYIDAIEKTLK